MRIEAYSQVQQIYNTQKTKSTAKAGTQSFKDALQISSKGKDFTVAKQAVAQAPDIRTDVTEPIKASLENGTYKVSANDFADKLLEKYNAYNALLG